MEVVVFFIVLALMVGAGIAVKAPDSGWENRRKKSKK